MARWYAFLLASLLGGCTVKQPFYLHGDDDQLSRYLSSATAIEYPDVAQPPSPKAALAGRPRTLSDPEFREFWNLPLQEAIHIALRNSKVIRSLGTVQLGGTSAVFNTIADPPAASQFLLNQARNSDARGTVFDVALAESNVGSPATQGVEAALSQFDAQVSTNIFWERTDRPQNTTSSAAFFRPFLFEQDAASFQAEIAKQTTSGTQFFFRNNTDYIWNNEASRSLPSEWQTNFEAEARQPLLRGAGTQVNRIPIVIARTRTDIELANFECNVRDLLFDVERAYWEHYYAFRFFQCQKQARDNALNSWRAIQALQEEGVLSGQDEAQARQQYLEFRARAEAALTDLYKSENRLRYMMGISPTDGRLIRPSDEPVPARVRFDWHAVLAESLIRSCELRQIKWRIKQRELELIAARNQLLPQLDVVGLYRWFGAGDHLAGGDGNAPPFPAEGSQALEGLMHGDFQEWRLGVELELPVGFRRELAGVRNAQLNLARDRALLEETELELTHLLTDDIQNIDGIQHVLETNFNRMEAANDEVRTTQVNWQLGRTSLNQLLDAQRRQADAHCGYYRALVNHSLAVTQIHLHKGSLLEYDNVHLAENAWPSKAYYDALQQARRRAAGHYLDYGYTRPRVVTPGPLLGIEHAEFGPPTDGAAVDGQTHRADGRDAGEETIDTPPARLEQELPTPARGLLLNPNIRRAADSLRGNLQGARPFGGNPLRTNVPVRNMATPRGILYGPQYRDAVDPSPTAAIRSEVAPQLETDQVDVSTSSAATPARSAAADAPMIEIVHPEGHVVRVPNSISLSDLQKLFRALERNGQDNSD